MQVTYPSLSKAHYPDDLSSNRYQPNSKLPERLIQRVSSVIQYSVHQVGDTPLQAHDALSTIKSAQDKTALRISKHSSVPGHTADRLKARQADLKLIYSAVSSNEIQLIGFIGWGDSTLTHVNSGQGISEYDSVVFLKDGVKYVEQLGSSYLRSRLALPPVKFATSSNSTPKLTPTGAVYNPETWRRVDSGNDSATLTVDRWPGTVSAHRGRADSIESQNSEISEPDELPTHSHPGLPSLKHEIEAYLEEHRPDLDRAIRSKNTTNILTELRNESQRHHTLQNGPKGLIPTVYTDLNAYGNPLEIAREISRHIERVVGNTHGTSQLAKVSTHYLNQAVAGILAHFGATPFKPGETDAQSSYDIVVRGAGFTGAFDEYLNHVKADLSRRGIALESGAISFTEYEHHSNSLPFQTWVGAATPATQLPITEA
ncbi:hypothetical protein EBR57_05600, partial [bacterium]|nr:hypothetical protein [bacterium]